MAAASSQGSEDGGGRDERRGHNLQGLLNFCIENTKSEDAEAASSSVTEMDAEVGY